MMRAKFLSVLAASLLAAPACAETPSYVTSGEFLSKSRPFDARTFVETLAHQPALRTALKTLIPNEEKLLIPYLDSYAAQACRRRHVEMNFDQTDFQEFFRRTALAQERLAAACRLLEKGEARASLKFLDEALALDPRFLDARLHRAIARDILRDAEGAGRDFLAARRIPAGTAPVEGVCACTPALAAAAKSIADRIDLGHQANARGIEFFRGGKSSEALAELREAIARNPADGDAFFNRAVVRQAAGDLRGALSDYQTAARLTADKPEILAGLNASVSRIKERIRAAREAPPQPAREPVAALAAGGPPAARSEVASTMPRAAPPMGPGLTALPAVAAVLPPRLGRTPAQYEWTLAELRGLWKRSAARIARFQRYADSKETSENIGQRLFAGEVVYAPVLDRSGRLLHLVMPDARVLAVSESEVRAYLGEGRGGGDLLAGLGLKAERFLADMAGRGLAIYDLALTRRALEICPDGSSSGADATSCLERASRELRSQGVFSVPNMEGEKNLSARAATPLCLEYARWQASSRKKAGGGAWRGWTGLPLEEGESRTMLAAFLTSRMERLWRKAQNRMGPSQPWIFGSTMAEVLSKSYPSLKNSGGSGGVLFFPKGREPLVVPKETQSLVREAFEPWEVIAAEMETAPANELAPLSPYAAEELSEMAAVLVGVTLQRAAALAAARRAEKIGPADLREAAALWDGSFEPAPSSSATAAGAWFLEVPTERSGLALPFPEAPSHSWEAPGDMPGGLAVLDYDRDGLPDLFFCDFEQAQLYRNLGGFRFENITSSAGLSGVNCGNGASSADYDGDGWPDLLVMHDKMKRDHLFRNDRGRFMDVTLAVGLSTAPGNTTSAVWFDFDRDGRLDLFLAKSGNYRQEVEDVGELRTGEPDRLYRNLGSRFEDVTARAGLGDVGWGLAAVSLDYDNDGWPDLDVLNDFGVNRLYRNQRDGTFRDVSHAAGVDSLGNGMGISAGDFDHDGNIDLFVTYPGADRPSVRYLFPEAARAFRLPYSGYFGGGSRYPQRNRLFRNSGDGSFSDAYLAKVEDVPTGWGWNGFFFDSDNRGWQDIFQVSGWWADQLAYSDQTMVFWRYDPASGRFLDASEASGLDFAGDSRVSAYADFDGDGCLDVVVTGFSPVRLFAGNCTRAHHWLAVRLEGTRSNRDGIGARVIVQAGALTQTAEMGSSGGGFQNSLLREVRFGLGEEPRADSIEVVWPGGSRQRLEAVSADRVLVIKEEK